MLETKCWRRTEEGKSLEWKYQQTMQITKTIKCSLEKRVSETWSNKPSRSTFDVKMPFNGCGVYGTNWKESITSSMVNGRISVGHVGRRLWCVHLMGSLT